MIPAVRDKEQTTASRKNNFDTLKQPEPQASSSDITSTLSDKQREAISKNRVVGNPEYRRDPDGLTASERATETFVEVMNKLSNEGYVEKLKHRISNNQGSAAQKAADEKMYYYLRLKQAVGNEGLANEILIRTLNSDITFEAKKRYSGSSGQHSGIKEIELAGSPITRREDIKEFNIILAMQDKNPVKRSLSADKDMAFGSTKLPVTQTQVDLIKGNNLFSGTRGEERLSEVGRRALVKADRFIDEFEDPSKLETLLERGRRDPRREPRVTFYYHAYQQLERRDFINLLLTEELNYAISRGPGKKTYLGGSQSVEDYKHNSYRTTEDAKVLEYKQHLARKGQAPSEGQNTLSASVS